MTALDRWLSEDIWIVPFTLLYPDKIVFGSDAFPFNDAVGAEESYWIAVRSARISLAAALAKMIVQHEASEEKALVFAHAYLHDTATALYAK